MVPKWPLRGLLITLDQNWNFCPVNFYDEVFLLGRGIWHLLYNVFLLDIAQFVDIIFDVTAQKASFIYSDEKYQSDD